MFVEATDARIFEDAEEFGLEVEVDVADFVEEDGAGVGGFEDADAVAVGTGEGSFEGTEELAFEQ